LDAVITPDWLPAVVVGPFIGSFLTTFIARHAIGQSALVGRSHCPICGAQLGACDLVPLGSWLFLRGRCRVCCGRISPLYPAIELAAVGIPIWAFWVTAGWVALATSILGWILLPLAIIDWRSHQLPDVLTLPLIPIGLIVAWMIEPGSVRDHAFGAAAGFIALFGVAWAYRRLRHREGLGRGDTKLLAGIGAWVTWQGLASVVLMAAVSALLVSIARATTGAPVSWTHRLPFGTFLAISGWLIWLYGPLAVG
jgi:leader peptidase (prepilin peptidase)/N-methyltransferase